VSHSEEFDAPAAAVWGLLVDWPDIARWMPDGYILGLRAEGHGVGAIRHLHTASGAEISERLDALDEAAGTIDLSILEPLPWGLRWYRARATLVPVAQERCRLTWRGTFEAAREDAADQAERLLGKSYARLFLGLRRELAVRAARASPA
jgi:hypothetical protein